MRVCASLREEDEQILNKSMSDFTLNGSPGLTEVWGSIMITKINSQLYLTPNRLASPFTSVAKPEKRNEKQDPCRFSTFVGTLSEPLGLSV